MNRKRKDTKVTDYFVSVTNDAEYIADLLAKYTPRARTYVLAIAKSINENEHDVRRLNTINYGE